MDEKLREGDLMDSLVLLFHLKKLTDPAQLKALAEITPSKDSELERSLNLLKQQYDNPGENLPPSERIFVVQTSKKTCETGSIYGLCDTQKSPQKQPGVDEFDCYTQMCEHLRKKYSSH